MDRATLVNFDIGAGAEIVEALDKGGIRPRVAMWAALDDYGDARLVIASDKIKTDSLREIDKAVQGVLEKSPEIDLFDSFSILTFRMTDPFIKDLRREYAKRLREGSKLVGQSFGGKYVEDAYIYRLE